MEIITNTYLAGKHFAASSLAGVACSYAWMMSTADRRVWEEEGSEAHCKLDELENHQ